MSEASGVGLLSPVAAVVAWDPPDRRRILQLALAALWLLDAVLQLQPFMFSRAFGPTMLGPTAQGNPALIAHPITDVSRSIGLHSVGFNAAFVVVQFLIAFGIAFRPTVRVALAGSVVWSLLVWWFGEGFGGVLAGTASPLTGAPGAVILYAVLAVILWPPGPGSSDAAFTAAHPVGVRPSKVIWVVVWGSLAGLALFGSSTRHAASLLSGMSDGEPRWLADLDHHAAALAAGRGLAIALVTGLVLAGIALSVFLPARPARVMIVAAIVVGLVVWVVGEDFGQLFSGSATDPDSGPLLVLLAAAYWPIRRPSGRIAAGVPFVGYRKHG
jgi:hypothetical protein